MADHERSHRPNVTKAMSIEKLGFVIFVPFIIKEQFGQSSKL